MVNNHAGVWCAFSKTCLRKGKPYFMHGHGPNASRWCQENHLIIVQYHCRRYSCGSEEEFDIWCMHSEAFIDICVTWQTVVILCKVGSHRGRMRGNTQWRAYPCVRTYWSSELLQKLRLLPLFIVEFVARPQFELSSLATKLFAFIKIHMDHRARMKPFLLKVITQRIWNCAKNDQR